MSSSFPWTASSHPPLHDDPFAAIPHTPSHSGRSMSPVATRHNRSSGSSSERDLSMPPPSSRGSMTPSDSGSWNYSPSALVLAFVTHEELVEAECPPYLKVLGAYNKLKSDYVELNKRHEQLEVGYKTLESNFAQLTTAVSDKLALIVANSHSGSSSSSPTLTSSRAIVLLDASTFSEAQRKTLFWDKELFDNAAGQRKNSSGKLSTIAAQSLRGGARGKQGINVMLYFIVLEDGTTATPTLTKKIRAYAKSLWIHLDQVGMAPASWGQASSVVKNYYIQELEAEFPVLRLCSGHWKANEIARIDYAGWRSRYEKKKMKYDPDEDEEAAQALVHAKRSAEELSDDDDDDESEHENDPRPARKKRRLISGNDDDDDDDDSDDDDSDGNDDRNNLRRPRSTPNPARSRSPPSRAPTPPPMPTRSRSNSPARSPLTPSRSNTNSLPPPPPPPPPPSNPASVSAPPAPKPRLLFNNPLAPPAGAPTVPPGRAAFVLAASSTKPKAGAKGKTKATVDESSDAAEGTSKKESKARIFTKGAAAYSVRNILHQDLMARNGGARLTVDALDKALAELTPVQKKEYDERSKSAKTTATEATASSRPTAPDTGTLGGVSGTGGAGTSGAGAGTSG